MKYILTGIQTNCNGGDLYTVAFIKDRSYTASRSSSTGNDSPTIDGNGRSYTKQVALHKNCSSVYSSSASNSYRYSRTASYSRSTEDGGRVTRDEDAEKQTFSYSNAQTFIISDVSQTRCTYRTLNAASASFSSASSSRLRVYTGFSGTENATTSETSSGTGSFLNSDSGSTSLDESECTTYGKFHGLLETTDSKKYDTVFFGKEDLNITRTSDVCTTGITNTNPALTLTNKYYTTENYTKFLSETTTNNQTVTTTSRVDYSSTYTLQADWTKTESTSWTSTTTESTQQYISTEQNTTSASRNSLGSTVEYGTTERINTTKETSTVVTATTSKETTVTGGTTETTSARRAKTDGTTTDESVLEVTTWTEGNSTRFLYTSSEKEINITDLDFCDSAGFVGGCITNQNEEYRAIVKYPEKSEAPYYTYIDDTGIDTGVTTGSFFYYSTSEYNIEPWEGFLSFDTPPIQQGTKLCSFEEILSSKSAGEISFTSYSNEPFSSRELATFDLETLSNVTGFNTFNETTLNALLDYRDEEGRVTLDLYTTEYNDVPLTSNFTLFGKNEYTYADVIAKAAKDFTDDVSYTTQWVTTESAVLLRINYSTEIDEVSYNHFFGWDLLRQTVLAKQYTSHNIKRLKRRNFGTYKEDTTTLQGFSKGNSETFYWYYTDGGGRQMQPVVVTDGIALGDRAGLYLTAVYEPDLGIGFIGFGEPLDTDLDTIEDIYGIVSVVSSNGETFREQDSNFLSWSNFSSKAILVKDSASIFYTKNTYCGDLTESSQNASYTTIWAGQASECSDYSDSDQKVIFGTSTQILATYSTETDTIIDETTPTTTESYRYATYDIAMGLKCDYQNPVLLKGSVINDRFANIQERDTQIKMNLCHQLKPVGYDMSYTYKAGDYEVIRYDKSNQVLGSGRTSSTLEYVGTLSSGLGPINVTYNQLFYYEALDYENAPINLINIGSATINDQVPRHLGFYQNKNLANQFHKAFKFFHSDQKSHTTDFIVDYGGRKRGWLAATRSICPVTTDSSG